MIHDNNISLIYSLMSESIIKKNNSRYVDIFCKLHQTHNKADVGNIIDNAVFHCAECGAKDFGGIWRIKQLQLNPDQDPGSTLLYFIRININNKITLKFGVTGIKNSLSDHRDIIQDKRFNHRREKVLEVLDRKVFDSELEARKVEQRILMNTLEYFDFGVDSSFGGYTECRVYSKKNEKILKKVFILEND